MFQCVKIGVLPNGVMYVGSKLMAPIYVGHKSLTSSLSHAALVLKVGKKYESSCCKVWHAQKNVPAQHRCGSATVLLWKILLAGLGTIN
jgi:hypothetical protein